MEVHSTAKSGDKVRAHRNTADSMGTTIVKADSVEEMIGITSDIDRYNRVEVD